MRFLRALLGMRNPGVYARSYAYGYRKGKRAARRAQARDRYGRYT